MKERNNISLQIKMYCKILGIEYDEIKNLPIDEQLERINSVDREGYKIVEQTKQLLSEMLLKEKEENDKLQADIAEAIRIVNSKHKSNGGSNETR